MKSYLLERVVQEYSRLFKPRWLFFDRIKNTERILELGCGTGVNYQILCKISSKAEFHGVDLLDQQNIMPGIIYQQLDLNEGVLPYRDEYFDAIIMSHVIEHLHYPLKLGNELNRILKKGGMIYIETPNWTTIFFPSFGFQREQGYPFNFYDDPTHVKPWSKQGLFLYLQNICGFNVECIRTIRVISRIPWDIIKIIYGLIIGNRELVINGFWNISGFCIYGVANKK